MTKKERFHKVAVARTQKGLVDMDMLSHCARPTMYEYTPTEAAQIVKALEAGLSQLKVTFEGQKTFRLTDQQSPTEQ